MWQSCCRGSAKVFKSLFAPSLHVSMVACLLWGTTRTVMWHQRSQFILSILLILFISSITHSCGLLLLRLLQPKSDCPAAAAQCQGNCSTACRSRMLSSFWEHPVRAKAPFAVRSWTHLVTCTCRRVTCCGRSAIEKAPSLESSSRRTSRMDKSCQSKSHALSSRTP